MEFAPDGPMALPLWVNGHAYLTVTHDFYTLSDPLSGTPLRRVPLAAFEAGFKTRLVVGEIAVEQRFAKLFLRFEVVVEGAFGNARFGKQFVEPDRREALAEDDRFGGIEDVLADVGVFGNHGGHHNVY